MRNKERAKIVVAAYYRNHKAEMLERKAAWEKEHPERIRAKNMAVRVRRLSGSVGRRIGEELDLIECHLKRLPHFCHYCGTQLPQKGWHADHMIPIARGGKNLPSNIVKACADCNFRKQNRTPEEYMSTIVVDASPVLR